MAKQINPSYSIAAGALIWSIAATCQAATFNRAGLFVCRLFVGVGEAFFGQAMAFHLSLWYTKHDLAKRVGLFISAGALSGAFGGLISFGVSSIQTSAIAQWRILFLIEGVPSLVLAICTALFMPGRPETSKYLNENERTLCLTRLNRDVTSDGRLGIQWAGVRRCLTDWKVYVISIAYSCMNLGLGSVGGFLPTIIKGECRGFEKREATSDQRPGRPADVLPQVSATPTPRPSCSPSRPTPSPSSRCCSSRASPTGARRAVSPWPVSSSSVSSDGFYSRRSQ
jgi:MFS family permease